MLPTNSPSIVHIRNFLLFAILAASAEGCTYGPFITHAAIQWPGATLRQVDESVARPVGRHLFGATNGVVQVIAISSAGNVDFYAKSDGLTKQPEFVGAMTGSLSDSTGMLPRGAAAGPIEVLPPGQPIPQPQVHTANELSIDIDRAKLIDTGLSYDDVGRAVAKAREDEAFRLAPQETPTEAKIQHMIQVLNATTLPSRDKPVTLGDVTSIHVVPVPDVLVRHWP